MQTKNAIAFFIGEPLKYAISIFKYFEDHPEEGTPEEAIKILGKPKTGISEYIENCKNTSGGK